MRFIFLLLTIACIACNGDALPKNILSSEKMRDVIFDVTRADETVDLLSNTDSTYRGNTKRYALYDSVFRIHGISKMQYEQSREWYQSRPALLKPMLESVRDKTDTSKGAKPQPAIKAV